MAGSMRLSLIINADGTAAIQSLNRVRDSVGGLDQAADRAASGGLGSLAGQLKGLAVTAAAGIGIAELARAFISVNLEAQKTAKALAAVTGSTQAAATEMAYIKDTANQMGLAVNDVATAYTNLMAASKGTALEGQATRDIFEAVSLTMAKLGKSSADTQGALLGLEQLMGQTTANLEDLRQVTDRIPGGMKLAAEGMGLTVAEMKEMISKGEILVADIVPGLTSELRRFYDDGQEIAGLQAEWNRFTNALADVAVGFDGVTDATGLLSNALSLATDLARGLASALAAAANAKAGLGLTTFADDAEKLAAMEARRLRALQDYQDAVALASRDNGTIWDGLTEWSADVEGKLQTLQQVSEEQFKFAAGLRESADAAREQAAAQAASMNDGAVKLYEEQRARVDEANQSLLKLNATYDDTAKRQLQVAEATKKYQAIAKDLGKDEAWVTQQVEKYTASLDKSTTAKGGAAKASKTLAAADRESAKAIAEAERAVQSLIDRYLPARAAAEDHARAQAAVAAALAGQAGSVALSAAEAEKIMGELTKEQAAAAEAARREADGFYKAWAEGVDRLDDTFQSLWRGLITGQGDVLGNLKETVLEWVADLSYQLLISPLIVPIQGSLMGIMGGGAGGVTGTATSVMGGASSLSSMFSTGSTLFNAASSLFSGATAAGITAGWGTAMAEIGAMGYGGAFTTIMGQAGSLAASGNVAASLAIAAPYLLPATVALAAAVAVFQKWQSDQEPRYGTLAAMTGGRAGGLEDSEWGVASGAYVKGSFGLNFGLTDKGSKNIEATELTEVYQALADVSDALAEFFGEDLSSFIEAELQKMSDFGDGLIHLTENEGDLGGAMAALVERIAQAAGRSSEDIGIAFGALVGDLSGTAEEVGKQIQAAMVATAMAVELSDQYDNTLGKMLELTGDIGTDVDLLKGYIDQFGQSGEATGDTLTRLVMQLGLLETAAGQTATQLEGLSAEAAITLSEDLIKAFGGPEAASQAMSFFYEEFTTQTEKLVDAITAAAERINQDVPKLQEELMKLSEDVTTTVVTATAALAEAEAEIGASLNAITGRATVVTSPAEGLDAIAAAIDEGMSGISTLGDAAAENLRRQAEGWVRSIDGWEDLYGVSPAFLISVTDGLELYGSALKDMGYVVDQGAQAFLESLRQAEEVAAGTEGELPTETITTPGDPNAAILAKLLDDLPKTREGFNELIGGLKLTDEASRKLYAGLMELLPQFDLLYDGVEAFTDWLLGVDEVSAATRELERVFSDWGLTLPENRDALKALYESGVLSAEQMAILAAYLKELGLVFGDLGEGVNGLNAELDTAMAALQRAVAAEKAALAETHEARMKALNAELEAANEALGDAQSLLNTVQGALNTLESAQGVSANEVNAALAQLTAWAASGITPDQEALSDALATLGAANASDYATAADYQAVQDQQYAALLALEQQGLNTVDTAQATVDALEAQLEQEAAFYEAEIERLDDLLASAEDQVALAEGTYAAALSVDEALAQLNALLASSGAAPVAGDPGAAGADGSLGETLGAQGAGGDDQAANLEAIRAEIAALRADLLAISSTSQARLVNLDDTLTKWDKDGLPAGDGAEITLLRAA